MAWTTNSPVQANVIVKQRKIVELFVAMLRSQMVVPNLFSRHTMDFIKDTDQQTVDIVIPGVLPFRRYDLFNPRTDPMVMDRYTERKIFLTLGTRLYQGVNLMDEERDLTMLDWGKLIQRQVDAIAAGITWECVSTLNSAAFEVTIGNASSNIRKAILQAMNVLDKMRAPAEGRTLLVGASFKMAILSDPVLSQMQAAGETRTLSALERATIRDIYGFSIVSSNDIAADVAYAFHRDAFILCTGVPSISAAAIGATVNVGDYTARWVTFREGPYAKEGSIVDIYLGTKAIKDPIQYQSTTDGQLKQTASEYQVRAIKLTLGGTSSGPAANTELATATGLVAADWTV